MDATDAPLNLGDKPFLEAAASIVWQLSVRILVLPPGFNVSEWIIDGAHFWLVDSVRCLAQRVLSQLFFGRCRLHTVVRDGEGTAIVRRGMHLR